LWPPEFTKVADVSTKLVSPCTGTRPTKGENNRLNTGKAGHFYAVPQTPNRTSISN